MKSPAWIVFAASSVGAQNASSSCNTTVATALVNATTNSDATACARAFNGTNLKAVFTTQLSSSNMQSIVASAECQAWYQGLSTTFHTFDPPCLIALGTQQFNSATYSVTLAEFLKINNVAVFNASTTTTAAPTVHNATTNATNTTVVGSNNPTVTANATNTTNATTASPTSAAITATPTIVAPTPAPTTSAPLAKPTTSSSSSAFFASGLAACAVAVFLTL
ncbi:Aste57867_16876 [Aphanomyces stellatus]|uniref:Aste57867_16876 protein n=1 Tax=Aphanomyces stellatus TaxID=120398 RepID=A0A485L9L7_9STRA|nr:hypothetical protein As57867_016818 [Aphanomyces stellatus]VFT93639.1 Aste57867_16876 [Aphanomyces stellatus]